MSRRGTAVGRYVPGWLEGVIPGYEDEHAAVTIKAHCWGSRITWAVADVLGKLLKLGRTSPVKLCKAISKESINWQCLCVHLGIPGVVVHIPSATQFEANTDPDVPLPAEVVEDHTTPTIGLIIMLLCWVRFRRARADRLKAVRFLGWFLDSCVAEHLRCRYAVDRDVATWSQRGTCRSQVQGGMCSHVRKMFAEWDTGCPLGDVMCGSMSHVFQCDRVSYVLLQLLQRVAEHIDGLQDELPFDWKVSRHAFAQSSASKRRPDRDYLRSLRESVVGERRTGGRGTAAALDGMERETIRRDDRREPMALRTAAWRHFSEAEAGGVWHLKEDAARIGQPAQDCSHSVLCWPHSKCALFLPPQDACLRSRAEENEASRPWHISARAPHRLSMSAIE